jgi:hypothetical protein
MTRRQVLSVSTVVSLVLSLCVSTPADVFTLGDLDGGHYDGLGSADHVYVDSGYLVYVVSENETEKSPS